MFRARVNRRAARMYRSLKLCSLQRLAGDRMCRAHASRKVEWIHHARSRGLRDTASLISNPGHQLVTVRHKAAVVRAKARNRKGSKQQTARAKTPALRSAF